MREVSQAEAMKNLPALLREASSQTLIILNPETGEQMGGLVSVEDLELVRQAKIREFLRLCEESSAAVAEKAKADGLSLADLEKILDRKAE
jgi:hypothetical protein